MTTGGRRPPLKEELALYKAVIAHEGVTTANGNVGGTTFIDAGLIGAGANAYVRMLAVMHPGERDLVDAIDITAFNNVTGEVTLNVAYRGGQVLAGVPYKIVTIGIGLGVAGGGGPGPAVYIDTVNGVAGTTGTIGTPSNPVNNLADAITIATARKLVTFKVTGALTLDRDITGYIFEGISVVMDNDASALWDFDFNGFDVNLCRFKNLKFNGGDYTCDANNGAYFEDCFFVTGITLDTAFFKRCYFADIFPAADATLRIDSPVDMGSNNINLSGATAGTLVNITNIGSLSMGIRNLINNSQVNLTFTAGGQVYIWATSNAGTVNIYGDCYIVNDGTCTLNIYKQTNCMDFWSLPQEEVAITNVAGDVALPSVTVLLPPGRLVFKVQAMFKYRVVENTNVAANKLSGAQEIQIRTDAPGAWVDAINFVDDQFGIAASTREGGDVSIGSINLATTVIGNDTYNFQWAQAVADVANLQFNDIGVGLRVWYY